MSKISAVLILLLSATSAGAFDRIEQKCLDAGYTITEKNCSPQTSPEDACPYHEKYFKSCSQAAWCRQQGYTYVLTDCKLPSFAEDKCPNNFPLYKSCREDIPQACREAGYKSQDDCQLSAVKCPYSADYGLCCTNCEDYPLSIEDLPRGFVQDGEACHTCSGKIRIKIKPAACEGYVECPMGPETPDTASCLSGKKMLYKSCQNSEIKCHAAGFASRSCLESEDAELCPDDNSYMRCKLNCEKLARLTFPNAHLIKDDVTNPEFNPNMTEIRSYQSLDTPECRTAQRPIITLNLSSANIERYKNIFDQYISDVDFRISMQNEENLDFNGHLQNAQLIFSGNRPECIFNSGHGSLSGEVKIKGASSLCSDITLTPETKFFLAANLKGRLRTETGSEVYITRNMEGLLQTGSKSKLTINGKLIAEDLLNSTINHGSVILGCNSVNTVKQGIDLNTSNLILKSEAELDTPQINLISKSDLLTLPNSLSSIHLYPQSQITHNLDANNRLDIAENPDKDKTCYDKYFIYLGSSFDESMQKFSLQADDRMEKEWQCQDAPEENKICD